MKVCRECAVEQDDGCFRSGNQCRTCENAQSLAYYHANRDRLVEQNRAWKQANSDKVQAQRRIYAAEHQDEIRTKKSAYEKANRERGTARQRTYRAANREKVNAWKRAWRAANSEKATAGVRAWKKANPERASIISRTSCARRRALQSGADADLTPTLWAAILDAFDHSCAYCGSRERVEQEHMVPIARGGCHTVANVVPACQLCNGSKNAKLLVEWLDSRTFPERARDRVTALAA